MSVHPRHGGFVVRWREAGKQRSKKFGTRTEAETLDIEMTREGHRAKLVRRVDRVTDPLVKIVSDWLDSRSISPVTRKSYDRSVFRPFLAHFAGATINSIREFDIERYFSVRRPLVKRSTLAKDFSILRYFFEWATRRFLLPENPIAGMKRITKVHRSPGICLSYEQEWKLLKAATPYQRTKILLARDCGFRSTNLGLLRRYQIDLEEKTLTYFILKKREDNPENAEARTLPLTPRLAEALEQFRQLDSQKCLFTYAGKSLRDPDKFLKRLRPKLGFHFRWHDLRHTFYTRLLEACDNYALTEWAIGHSMTYWHPSPEKIRDAFGKMDAATQLSIENLELEQMLLTSKKEKR